MNAKSNHSLPIDNWIFIFEKLDLISLHNASLCSKEFTAVAEKLTPRPVAVLLLKDNKSFLSCQWNETEEMKIPEVCLHRKKYNKCMEMYEEQRNNKEQQLFINEKTEVVEPLTVGLEVEIMIICSTSIDADWLDNLLISVRIRKVSTLVIYDCALRTENILSSLLDAFKPSELSIQHLQIGSEQITDEVLKKAELNKLIIYNVRVPITDALLESTIELFYLTGGSRITSQGVAKLIEDVKVGGRRLHSFLIEDVDVRESTDEATIIIKQGNSYTIQKGHDFFYMLPK